jgi:hypothetical protein
MRYRLLYVSHQAPYLLGAATVHPIGTQAPPTPGSASPPSP